MRLSSATDELNDVRKPILIAVAALVVFAAMANVGYRLAGALRQVDALARTDAGGAAAGVLRATDAAPASAAATLVPNAEVLVERATEARKPLEPEPEGEPYVPFDVDAALRAAGDHDPNVAELLDDPDPAVGDAVREFITHLDPPGGR